MSENILVEDVRKAVAQVKHPAINQSLINLGIVRDIAVEGGQVTITMAFPFPNIPIQDMLIKSVTKPVENLGANVEVNVTVMTQEEQQKFFALEQEYWIG